MDNKIKIKRADKNTVKFIDNNFFIRITSFRKNV